MIFDVEAAEAAKLEGMARAYEHAPEVWRAEAAAVVERLAKTRAEFTADDVWRELWMPPEHRALGAVMRNAALDGLIEKAGRVRLSARPVHHHAPLTVWRSLVWKGQIMTPRRILLLHSKSDDDATIERLTELARVALSRSANGQPFQVITGRDFYEQRFKAAGSWGAWAMEAGAGVDYLTRQPTFHGYLVPSNRVGAATAKIIEAALGAGRPVFVFREDGTTAHVSRIVRGDSKDWKGGWFLVTGPYIRKGGES